MKSNNWFVITLMISTFCSMENKTNFEMVGSIVELKKVGQVWINSIGIDLAFIPSGQFKMGSNISNYELPVHTRIIRKFAISTTEVTVNQFSIFLNESKKIDSAWVEFGNDFPLVLKDKKWQTRENIDSNEPMVWVNYNGARAFCNWLSEKDGITYRLPSEAEWEYACKAGTFTHFYFGNKVSSEMVNFNGQLISDFGIRSEFREKPLAVKSFTPNKWGLYDMHGNVWEFCQDYWHDHFNGAPSDQSAWMDDGDSTQCVIKGGSWFSDDKEVRSAVRFGEPINESNAAWGFRIAADIQ